MLVRCTWWCRSEPVPLWTWICWRGHMTSPARRCACQTCIHQWSKAGGGFKINERLACVSEPKRMCVCGLTDPSPGRCRPGRSCDLQLERLCSIWWGRCPCPGYRCRAYRCRSCFFWSCCKPGSRHNCKAQADNKWWHEEALRRTPSK